MVGIHQLSGGLHVQIYLASSLSYQITSDSFESDDSCSDSSSSEPSDEISDLNRKLSSMNNLHSSNF